jgi:unsaturated rhamnogalacturonyl hydrolase
MSLFRTSLASKGMPLLALLCAVLSAQPTFAETPAAPRAADVLAIAEKAADWQIANPSKHPLTDWTQAAWYAGMMALADISSSPRFLDAMVQVGEKNDWKLGPRRYHADDNAVGQMYVEVFLKKKDPKMIAQMREEFDAILASPKTGDLDFEKPNALDKWVWCDALFMAPPALVRLYYVTGKQAYLDYMVEHWWQVSDYLYDRDEHLYFRDSRYFKRREANGKKVFWSRGNGWVMAGLARVLTYLPLAHDSRPKFEQQFKEMAAKIIQLQQPDGLWHSSLLDPETYPMKETSGSGFYCYALAWGINQGYLDRPTYLPVVYRAWHALTEQVRPDGKVTHVQPIGDTPKTFDPELTEVFGVGAFLLASSEVYRLVDTNAASK